MKRGSIWIFGVSFFKNPTGLRFWVEHLQKMCAPGNSFQWFPRSETCIWSNSFFPNYFPRWDALEKRDCIYQKWYLFFPHSSCFPSVLLKHLSDVLLYWVYHFVFLMYPNNVSKKPPNYSGAINISMIALCYHQFQYVGDGHILFYPGSWYRDVFYNYLIGVGLFKLSCIIHFFENREKRYPGNKLMNKMTDMAKQACLTAVTLKDAWPDVEMMDLWLQVLHSFPWTEISCQNLQQNIRLHPEMNSQPLMS